MTKEEIGSIIKESRIAAGLTQLQVAEAIKRPQNTISAWEMGRAQPDANTLFALFRVLGRSVDDAFGFTSKTFEVTLPEREHIKKYRTLDRYGKEVVDVVMDRESARVQEEDAKRKAKELYLDEADQDGERSDARVIPLYFTPAAAGFTSPAFGEDFEYIEIGGDVPRQADFAVKIDGDSMEPYIMDGSTVYVNRDPLEVGDVGVFCVDGDMLCKQYYKDDRGNVRLLSLNRNRQDADRFIGRGDDVVLTCYGRVILPERPRISL